MFRKEVLIRRLNCLNSHQQMLKVIVDNIEYGQIFLCTECFLFSTYIFLYTNNQPNKQLSLSLSESHMHKGSVSQSKI